MLSGQNRTDYFFHQTSNLIYPDYLLSNGERLFSSESTARAAQPVVDDCHFSPAVYWGAGLQTIESWPFVELPDGGISKFTEASWQGDTLVALGVQTCYDGSLEPAATTLARVGADGVLLEEQSFPGCGEEAALKLTSRDYNNHCPVLALDEDGRPLLATTNGLISIGDDGLPYHPAPGIELDQLLGIVKLSGPYLGMATDTKVAVADLAAESLLLTVDAAPAGMIGLADALWYISGSELGRLGTDLSSNTWALPATGAEHLRITTYQDKPMVYAPRSDGAKGWVFHPETESFELLIDWQLDEVEIVAIAPFREDSLFVAGRLRNSLSGNGFVKKARPDSFVFQKPFDVGVRSMELQQLSVETLGPGDVAGTTRYRVFVRQAAEVENYGEGVVREFNLDWDFRHDYCQVEGYRPVEGLELQPGAVYSFTDTLVMSIVVSGSVADNVTTTFGTFAPNHYLDADPQNDAHTANFLLTDTQEESIPAGGIRLFPNPATDEVQLQSEVPLHELELFDMFGRRLRHQQLEGDQSTVIPRRNLPAGVYLLRMRSGERSATRQIIWSKGH